MTFVYDWDAFIPLTTKFALMPSRFPNIEMESVVLIPDVKASQSICFPSTGFTDIFDANNHKMQPGKYK